MNKNNNKEYPYYLKHVMIMFGINSIYTNDIMEYIIEARNEYPIIMFLLEKIANAIMKIKNKVDEVRKKRSDKK